MLQQSLRAELTTETSSAFPWGLCSVLTKAGHLKGRNVNTRTLSGLWSENEPHKLLSKQFLGFRSGIGKWFYRRDNHPNAENVTPLKQIQLPSLTGECNEILPARGLAAPAAGGLSLCSSLVVYRWRSVPGWYAKVALPLNRRSWCTRGKEPGWDCVSICRTVHPSYSQPKSEAHTTFGFS